MSTFLITYDLRQPGRNYDDLYDRLRAYGTWAHPLESVWLITTNQNAVQIRDYLTEVIDQNDRLLVVAATRPGAWRHLAPEVSEWLQAHL